MNRENPRPLRCIWIRIAVIFFISLTASKSNPLKETEEKGQRRRVPCHLASEGSNVAPSRERNSSRQPCHQEVLIRERDVEIWKYCRYVYVLIFVVSSLCWWNWSYSFGCVYRTYHLKQTGQSEYRKQHTQKWNEILNCILRECAEQLCPPLKIRFQNSLRQDKLSKAWKLANITPSSKSGDKQNTKL